MWWITCALVFLVAAGLSVLFNILCRRIGVKGSFLDKPVGEDHKQHAQAVPDTGGMGMLFGWLCTLLAGFIVVYLFTEFLPPEFADYVSGVTQVMPRLLVIAGGGIAFAVMGFVDDRRNLGAGLKLVLQVAIALAIAVGGFRVTLFLPGPLFTVPLTVAWIVFIVNALNFFDNMDSMAGGCSLIAATLFALAALFREQYFVALLGVSVAGVALGFLFFNWPPAKIFMGDSGSHFLGYMLAALGASTTFYTPGVNTIVAPALIPLLILALPIFDVFAVVLIRWIQGRPVYEGDKMHVSHRFLRMGMSEKQAAWSVHLISLAIGAGALPLLWLPPAGIVAIFLQGAAILAVISIVHFQGYKSNENESFS